MIQRSCRQCRDVFTLADADISMLERLSPTLGGETFELPLPTLCPECRLKRRMLWRNERNIFPRTCDKTGRRIISAYTPEKAFPVYHIVEWWKDDNDPLIYGREYDHTTPLFPQFAELLRVVPRMHVNNFSWDRQENSDYTNCAGDMKDCYLLFGSARDERCMYGLYVTDCFDCVDTINVYRSRECYECVDVEDSERLFFAQDCRSCHDSAFLFDCRGCHDCIACTGLRRKSYHIFNQPFSKADFLERRARLLSGKRTDLEALKQQFDILVASAPHRYLHGDRNENCIGDAISNSKNCWWCFDTDHAEDCRYCAWFQSGRDCMDFFSWGEGELCYEITSGGESTYRSLFCSTSYGATSCLYCDSCMYCKNCFACAGLKREEFCILNKRYSPSDYFGLVRSIIANMRRDSEWGEFWPASLSPFAYNESTAHDSFPMTKEQALAAGYPWSDYTTAPAQARSVIRAEELPDSIDVVSDEILESAVECAISGKLYRFTKAEIMFYRSHNLPLPSKHPDERHVARTRRRNPKKLWARDCAGCGTSLFSSYAPERSELIYCDDCYLKKVY